MASGAYLPGLVVTNSNGAALYAGWGSVGFAHTAESEGLGRFQAEYGSDLDVGDAVVTNAATSFYAGHGSTMMALDAEATDSTYRGFSRRSGEHPHSGHIASPNSPRGPECRHFGHVTSLNSPCFLEYRDLGDAPAGIPCANI